MNKLKQLGPGLLYAGAAVGVSHIVQSTKAGAWFGYEFIILIIGVHILKYPFFQLGALYPSLTGKSLLHGYQKLGNWALGLILLASIITMFSIQSAVTMVTASIAAKVFGVAFPLWIVSTVILVICGFILYFRRLDILQNVMKVIILILTISTILAVLFSFGIDKGNIVETPFHIQNEKHVLFLIAFLGWMPAPLDISIWQSLWKAEALEYKKSAKPRKLFDFKVGFWGTAFLAILFLVLGANAIYGTGEQLSSKGTVYASQLIDIYSRSLGEWAYYIIAIAALFTMFSTTLTCLDAVPRVVEKGIQLWRPKFLKFPIYLSIVGLLVLGTVLILKYFVGNMGALVDFATSVSFITAPIIAILGMMVVKKHLPKGTWSSLNWFLAYTGVTFLLAFSLTYINHLI